MESLTDFLHRVSEGASAVARAIFDQICWVFEAEEWSPDIRKQFYSNIAELLRMQGSSLSSTDTRLLSRIILRCCNDIDPTPTSSNQPAVAASTSSNSSKKANSRPAPSMNADNFTSSADPSTITPPSAFPGLYESAWALLPVFLTHTPSQVISFLSRTAIDRTAILVQHKEAMLASVLRPPYFKAGRKTPSSILPHLARAAGGELRVEGILRPRFPPIKSTSAQVNGDEDRDSDPASADDHLGPMYPEQNGTAEASTLDVPDSKLNNNSYLDLIAPSQLGNTTKAPSAHDFIASSREVQGEKRPVDAGSHSLDAQDHPSTKRIRIGSSAALDAVDISASQPDVATAPRPGHPQIEPQRLATTPKAAEYGNIEDDDDDDFEIPELVMDADTEDEDEGGEADEDGN
ncbi:MAG: hypothetical protein M1825_000994 [Sarcosagium campestre]|nr:MAG: hypothetical protein M1825_000994 [Sarcosagium campestre]